MREVLLLSLLLLPPLVWANCSAATGAQFMGCLNGTERTDASVHTITLEGDIFLHPEDWEPYRPWLPIHTGVNGNVTLNGAHKPGGSGALAPILDFGGALALSYHAKGVTWAMENMRIQGLAAHSAGYRATSQPGSSADFGFEMVNGILWPTMVGEPGHWMVFRNVTIVPAPGAPCGGNATQFRITSLRREAGREGGIDALPDGGYIVRQLFEGSYPVRRLETGNTVGNVFFAFEDVIIACPPPEPATATGASPRMMTPLASAEGVGIAGSAQELLYYLGEHSVHDIILAGHIRLDPPSLANPSLPLVLARGRNLTLRSADNSIKVLDLGQATQLLMLEATASLSLCRLEVQGVAFPSAVYPTANVRIEGSPLWPTVSGVPGHRVSFQGCVLHVVKTPCSTNSTQIEIELLQRAVGSGFVGRVGDTSYAIYKPSNRTVYFRDLATDEQLYESVYFYNDSILTCLEDSGVALAHEIMTTWSPPAARPSNPAASHSSSPSAGVLGGIIGAAVGGAVATAAAGLLLVRRRRRRAEARARQAKAVAGSLVKMESGELTNPSSDLALLPVPALEDPSDPAQAPSCSAAAKNTLWRSK